MHQGTNYYFLKQLFLGIVLMPFFAFGQISVSNSGLNNNPTHLISNVLIGDGVTVTSVNFIGDTSSQFGVFKDLNKSIIGLDSGIVISTGDVREIQKNFTGGLNPAPNITDNDLLTIANSVPALIGLVPPFTVTNVNNVAAIEFDFVPQSDSVEFRFVFGSEEYPLYINGTPINNGFINQQYNDVFGFFISGPGITGPYSSPAKFPGGSQNVALVPNSNPPLPITVSSVHNGTPTISPLNSQFFVPGDSALVELNGFTIPLSAKLNLSACDTFHIRLAIGDGEDQSLNSAVFIEARSFNSPNVRIDAVPEFYTLNNDGKLYEDCGNVNLTFKRFNNINTKRRVNFNISGTAQNGIDYTFIPDSIIFQPGNSTSSISINIFSDGLAEGNETFIIGIKPDTIGCVFQDSSTTVLQISDPLPLQFVNDSINVDCFTDTFTVRKSIIQGIEPFNYFWSTGDTIDTLVYTPIVQDSSFFVTVTDACKNDTLSGRVRVTNIFTPISISGKSDTILCTDTAIGFSPQILAGSSQQNYVWSNGKTNPIIYENPPNDTFYVVTVTDLCLPATFDTDTFFVYRNTPQINLFTKSDTIDCTENSGVIEIFKQGGSPKQKYLWSTGDTLQQISVSKLGNTTKYYVTVTDFCDSLNPLIDSAFAYEINPPLSSSILPDTLNCNIGGINIQPKILTGSTQQFYLWNTGDTTKSITVNPISTTKYFVTITDVCSPASPITDSVQIVVNTPPLVFNIDTQSVVCDTAFTTINVNITSGSAPLQFLWSNNRVSPSFKAQILSDTTFTLTIIDGCGVTKSDTAFFNFIEPQPIISSITDTTIDCPKDSAILSPTISGGTPPYDIIWITGANTQQIGVAPDTTTSYIYQITDLCPITLTFDTVTVRVLNPPNVLTIINDTTVNCINDSLFMRQQTGGGVPPYTYAWRSTNNMSSDSTYFSLKNITDTTKVFLTATDKCSRTFSDSAFVFLNPVTFFEVTLPSDTSLCVNEPLSLTPNFDGGVSPFSFQWFFNGDSVFNDFTLTDFLPPRKGELSVIANDRCNNTSSDIQVVLVKNCDLKVTNIFTPNGDKRNDFFEIQGINTSNDNNLPTAKVTIFNRWGQMLFEANPYQNNWDGYPHPDGVYYYMIELSNGETIKGSITLIR